MKQNETHKKEIIKIKMIKALAMTKVKFRTSVKTDD